VIFPIQGSDPFQRTIGLGQAHMCMREKGREKGGMERERANA
jgi:hypothetical protein